MPYKNLREFLEKLKDEGQLLKIDQEVWPEPDLSAAACAINQLGEQSPALFFDKIKGYTNAQIALNVHGSWPNMALALDLPKNASLKEQFFDFIARYGQYESGKVEWATEAPWQEVVITEDINLYDILPLFRLNQGDGGFYIDKSVVVTRDLMDWDNFNTQNVGIYRLQIKGRDRIGIQPVPEHDIAIHLARAEELGKDLPIAICVSNDPLMGIVASMPILYDQSEYKMVAAIQGKPYTVVKTELTDLDVPWGSEFILEGHIISRLRECEGPFGEFTGHYSGARQMPVVKITKVSHRKNPIFEHLYIGMPWTEIDYLLGINTCAPLYMQLKQSFPEIQAVNALYIHGLVVIVSTKCRFGGFAKTVGMRTLTTPHGMGYAKVVIVVDETVDPFNLPQVMWALATKFNPQYDIVTVPGLSVLELDPSSDPVGMTAKVIIDATTPRAPDDRAHFPPELQPPVQTDVWLKKLRDMLTK